VATNPVQIQLKPCTQLLITCDSHAAYFQRVKLTWNGGGVVFQGSGEGVAMATPSGQTLYQLPGSVPMTVTAQFEYSPTGPGGPFKLAQVVEQPVTHMGQKTMIIDVTSEDSIDKDDNDSYLSLVLIGVKNT